MPNSSSAWPSSRWTAFPATKSRASHPLPCEPTRRTPRQNGRGNPDFHAHGRHDLIEALSNVEASVGEDFDLDLIDMEGVACDEPDCKVPWPTARNHAAVLAPWLDMDPDARLGKDPVSFLLAMAPDTAQVGLLTDNWIIGGTL